VLLGVENDDTKQDADWLCKKIVSMRLFADVDDKMNQSILDVNGNILLISQFTLHAKTKKGNRPSFIKAARPEHATPLYNYTIETFNTLMNKPIESGEFGAMMDVSLINSGPVTIFVDTKNKE
jgi:D-tyrosyl-tRNA(Tyr) deacylase